MTTVSSTRYRKPAAGGGFTHERNEVTTLGRVLVHIPAAHRVGEIGSSWWTRIKRLDLRDAARRLDAAEHAGATFWRLRR